MAQDLANALEGRLTSAIWVSAVIALVIVAIVAITWWMGRRIVRHRSRSHWNTAGIQAFSRGKEPMEQPKETHVPQTVEPRSSEEAWASRLVRDTAQRAATLRDTWDRSYRTARTSDGPEEASKRNLADVAEELLREQRHTNELLQELVDRFESRAK
jgi:hypothetical protein